MFAAGSAAVWPVWSPAQQTDKMHRIGLLHDFAENDPEGQAQVVAFRDELRKLAWTEGGNTRIDYRSAAVDADLVRKYAAEMIALGPDVVVAAGGTIVAALQRASRSVPIVFVNVTDPAGGGLVDSWHDPVAMLPALPNSSSASARNGLRF